VKPHNPLHEGSQDVSHRDKALGKTCVSLTELGFGGAPWGELFVRVDETATAGGTA